MPADPLSLEPQQLAQQAAHRPAEPEGAGGVDHPRITLLGPQRKPRVNRVASRLGLRGRRFAMITAGWRDRESDDDLLHELLGRNTVNLRLWQRMQHVWDVDPELAAGDRRRRQVLTEMQELYQLGLVQAAEMLDRLRAHTPRIEEVRDQALLDIEQIIRGMDTRHLHRVNETHLEFFQRYQPQHRDAVVRARFEIGREIADCEAVAIPGGHVGVLLGALHMFNLGPALATEPEPAAPGEEMGPAPRPYRPILAWGAGAMALTERVLLFYDNSVANRDVTEVLMDGLGLTRGLIALPSATERLDIRNTPRMATLVRRMEPRVPLMLDPRVEITLTADGRVPAGVKVLRADGTPGTLEPEVTA